MWTREHWDANDGAGPTSMLVNRANDTLFIEEEFVLAAARLRYRADAFDDVWSLINHLNDGMPDEGLDA